MVQLKGLMVALVIISLNSFCNTFSKANRVRNMKHYVSARDTILLREFEYIIVFKDTNILNIRITDVNALHKIMNVASPILSIELAGKKLIAKGNNVLASSVPEECNYFYPLNSNGMAIIQDGLISLRKLRSI